MVLPKDEQPMVKGFAETVALPKGEPLIKPDMAQSEGAPNEKGQDLEMKEWTFKDK